MHILSNIFLFAFNAAWVFCLAMALMKFPTWKYEPGKVMIAVVIALWFGYVGMDIKTHDFECNKDYKGHCM